MASSAGAAALACAVALSLWSPVASAFCRTSVCNHMATSQVCTPSGSSDCGTPLFWASDCIGFSMQSSASKSVSLSEATQIFTDAFENWSTAKCSGGGMPHLRVIDNGPAACHKVEYNPDGGNANIIQFDDDSWPYAGADDTLALTTVTYSDDTGEIFDADMELNSSGVHFTTGDTSVDYDLKSIAQHETGHFLGLAHSPDPTATMFATYKAGDTSLRTLAPDDVSGICVVYPPGQPISPKCDATPRHGFSSVCGADETTSGCRTAAPGEGRPSAAVAACAVLFAAARARRKRRPIA